MPSRLLTRFFSTLTWCFWSVAHLMSTSGGNLETAGLLIGSSPLLLTCFPIISTPHMLHHRLHSSHASNQYHLCLWHGSPDFPYLLKVCGWSDIVLLVLTMVGHTLPTGRVMSDARLLFPLCLSIRKHWVSLWSLQLVYGNAIWGIGSLRLAPILCYESQVSL